MASSSTTQRLRGSAPSANVIVTFALLTLVLLRGLVPQKDLLALSQQGDMFFQAAVESATTVWNSISSDDEEYLDDPSQVCITPSYNYSVDPKKGNLLPEPGNPYWNPSTNFTLNCPCFLKRQHLPPSIKKVHLVYHVGMVKNWKSIVQDQMHTLAGCGLGHVVSSMTITYTNGAAEELRAVLEPFAFMRHLKLTMLPGPQTSPWEQGAMQTIYDQCTRYVQQHPPRPDIVGAQDDEVILYFHNKGASKYNPHWREQLAQVWTYSRSLYWRKYMEYFLLERPALCLHAIAGNNETGTCGAEFHTSPTHYSGNFWMASCRYVAANLKRMNITPGTKGSYTMAEMWIGSDQFNQLLRQPNASYYQYRHVSLYDDKGPVGFYRHLITPEEYVIRNETRALELVKLPPSEWHYRTFGKVQIADELLANVTGALVRSPQPTPKPRPARGTVVKGTVVSVVRANRTASAKRNQSNETMLPPNS